jgi:hypothetical protein
VVVRDAFGASNTSVSRSFFCCNLLSVLYLDCTRIPYVEFTTLERAGLPFSSGGTFPKFDKWFCRSRAV